MGCPNLTKLSYSYHILHLTGRPVVAEHVQVVIAFAREGADIALVFKSHTQDAEDTKRFVTAADRKCLLLQADVSVQEQCEDAVRRCVAELGKLDILVNNAGIQYGDENPLDMEHFSAADLDRVFRTNAYSAFFLTACALQHMQAGSTIINCTSINAFKGNANLVSYTASKGALQAFTRSMAQQLASKQIRVNAVAPGPIWTPFITATFSEEKQKDFGSATLMKRAGQPVECAPAFVFLASTDSSFMTGQTIHVDGGQYTSS